MQAELPAEYNVEAQTASANTKNRHSGGVACRNIILSRKPASAKPKNITFRRSGLPEYHFEAQNRKCENQKYTFMRNGLPEYHVETQNRRSGLPEYHCDAQNSNANTKKKNMQAEWPAGISF